MKRILSICLVFCCLVAKSQYNNEWIDYSKTYYKFTVGKDGVFRIPDSVLQTVGLHNVPAEQFQLWRNGVQVPIYTSAASGLLGASGYIEFWGEINDGKPDRFLYRDINNQLSDKWSLYTDTATYFLTVNPAGNNQRLLPVANNVAGNTLPEDAYFMYTYNKSFKNRINHGYAGIVGEYVYSSSYDRGEGYTSNDIGTSPLNETVNNLFPYAGGPNGTFFISAFGNANYNRKLRVHVNNTQLIDVTMDSFNDTKQQVELPASLISTGSAAVRITNVYTNGNDRMVVGKYEFTYAREFNFGNTTNFVFELDANSEGNYLKISNFNHGNTDTLPVLYDLTNFRRYSGDKSQAGVLQFVLQPSMQKRKLVLVNERRSNLTAITSLTPRSFVNYALPENQGDYLIISHPLLYTGANGNPVEAYRQYRSSSAGGGYTARAYDITQLVDQFAFGIKGHPFSVKNFIRYADDVFSIDPRAVFLIGKGVSYVQAKSNESSPLLEKLNLVPTFGYPASDNLLAARDNQTISNIPIGRLSAVTGGEVDIYLEKIKEYESIGVGAPGSIEGRGWMRNVVHAIGGGDAALSAQIGGYMNQLKVIIEDTLYGGNVKSFSKSSAVASQITSQELQGLFAEGIGILNYFGHSSSSTLEFNIEDPYVYQNQGKYPLFFVNGCLAGDIFNFDAQRFSTITTLSEKYLLANQRGSIAFVASSHFGIVNYLNFYLQGVYKSLSGKGYGKDLGKLLIESFEYILQQYPGDFFARLHAEEITLHGDPVVKPYTQELPDYVVEDALVKLPPLISLVDNKFDVSVKFLNLGKAIRDSFYVTVRRQLPDGSTNILIHQRIRATNFADSINFSVAINPTLDKGENKLFVVIDSENEIDEISETNNSVTKTFYVVDDGARPVFPYNYSIVSATDVTFYASTSDPLAAMREYVMEIDTTMLFNSSLKKQVGINSSGGIIQFKPAMSFLDSTVYYWRVAKQGDDAVWNSSSFVYFNGGDKGYNQSHFYQFKNNTYTGIHLNEERAFEFEQQKKIIKISTGIYPHYVGGALYVYMDDDIVDTYGCLYNTLQFVVYDKVTKKPWPNSVQQDGFGRFGSVPPCGHNNHTFEFSYTDTAYRRKAIDFLASIPEGSLVSITSLGMTSNTSFIADWKKDTTHLGSGKSLYHALVQQGLTEIDRFTQNLPFIFFFKKDDFSYPVQSFFGDQASSLVSAEFEVFSAASNGKIRSEWMGPAIEWEDLQWNGKSIEADPDITTIDVFGRNMLGGETLLSTIKYAKDTTVSFVDARQFPYLRLVMNNTDSVNGTPYQLKRWTLTGVPAPEGAIMPIAGSQQKDTIEIGEIVKFSVGFKNISATTFDSVKVKFLLIDRNNVQHIIDSARKKPLIAGDTIKVDFSFDSQKYPGLNALFFYFNPDNDQPEQYLYNNFLFKDLFVKPDTQDPLLDVTFDGVHILNQDIVSSRPNILVKLRDNSKFMILDDTALAKVQVRYPNGTLKTFSFNSDTLRFIPPVYSGDSISNNTSTIEFKPSFFEDGDYELIISARDKSGNVAGKGEYKVSFKVINKPMISNMLNYPNPFTTSTAFVFTLTGSEVPQNIRIQILTITGKIVREITKQELGDIRIGRNITEFKWDGTDQFGQKLANGVYLYRVITNLDGKSLEQYKAEGDRTDQFFNKGYGKMYLMR
ncbi:MAG: hypothetical protein KIT80_07185 [Chitinophagaceae bacterium]|nr:hypothetical protein [Chitinophagaceae bacterium]MCW5926680.1 hypothetical protein [Chitinophagaceae bacterium]